MIGLSLTDVGTLPEGCAACVPQLKVKTSSRLLAHLALTAAAVLFGATYSMVQEAIEEVDIAAFLAVRFLIGAAVLTPFARRRPAAAGLGRAGLACGLVLLAAYVLQTVGLRYTTSSASAFLTYLFVVIVPLLSAVVLRRRPAPATLLALSFATAGLVMLHNGRWQLGWGELLTVGCAVALAVHILLLGRFAPRYDPVRFTAVQLATVGVACLVPGGLGGGYGFTAFAWVAAVTTGIAVSAVAFLLQMWAQKVLSPTRTALLLLIEPIVAALFGFIAGDQLGFLDLAGAGLILMGVLAVTFTSSDR